MRPYPARVTADVVLRRARLVPLDQATDAPSDPVDVLVLDGRIVAIGPTGTDLGSAAGGVDVVDLDGRWLVPGLWDAHVHMDQWAHTRRRLDVSAATSAREAAATVVAALRAARDRGEPAPEPFLVAAGFRDGLWPDEPTSALLDDALAAAGLPPVAVVLVSADIHTAWMSTPALARFGAADHPTGLLREAEWMPRMGLLGDVPTTVLDAWVADAARAAAERGVVGVVDLEIADNLASWGRRVAGEYPVRVSAGVWAQHLDAVIGAGLRSGDAVPGTGGLVTQGSLKVIVDGSLNTRTAWCHDPFPGATGPEARGRLTVGPDRLLELMARGHAHGLECAIHAIGDAALDLVLDAFEVTGARGTVEHVQLADDTQLARLAALGLVASVQPEHAVDDRDVADRHWAGRTARAFAYGSMVRAGVRLALGSDAPVAPLDPWHAVAAAVERTRDGREPWHPEQAIDARTALASSVRSRVAVGQPADLAVLDADPLAPDADLRHMPVAATLLAGRWTYAASGPPGEAAEV